MIIRNQKDCPYCHHETRRKHNVLLNYTFLTSDDDFIEATVDINTDKSMSLIVGDYYGDGSEEIKINYCPMCGRRLKQ